MQQTNNFLHSVNKVLTSEEKIYVRDVKQLIHEAIHRAIHAVTQPILYTRGNLHDVYYRLLDAIPRHLGITISSVDHMSIIRFSIPLVDNRRIDYLVDLEVLSRAAQHSY